MTTTTLEACKVMGRLRRTGLSLAAVSEMIRGCDEPPKSTADLLQLISKQLENDTNELEAMLQEA